MIAKVKEIKREPMAPCPKRGLMKLLYEMVEDLGPETTRDEIIKYLPASDGWDQAVDRERIDKALSSLKSRGFVVHHSDTDVWRIASLEQYRARQAYMNDPDRVKVRQPGRGKRVRKEPEVIYRHEWYFTVACLIVGFAVGYFTGLMGG